jgi:hypothetical protein
LKLFCFRYIKLREIIENNFPFSPEFERPFFRSVAVPGRLDALLAKSLAADVLAIIS